MPIRKLPPLLVSQIAAGEVIERPASVVKELVENSLDAGATQVDIHVEEGGRDLIRIRDDGCGIPAGELELALTAHATSKLQTAEQLAAIATLGFRGEALASVASVSRVRLTSRARRGAEVAEAGAVIEAAGDEFGPVRPVGCAPGTLIEVRDLFFNTPARRKFMRGASAEIGHISDIIARIAMAHPETGFTLTHGSRKTLDLPAERSRRRRCVAVLGKELEEALLDFEAVEEAGPDDEAGGPAATIWGLAGLPAVARATARFQHLCVNGRPIRDRSLMHALKEAYRGLIPPDRHPQAVLFLDLAPQMVDVNVHPGKAEVRFREPSRIHRLVMRAVRQCLLDHDLTPTAAVANATPALPPGEIARPGPFEGGRGSGWSPAAFSGGGGISGGGSGGGTSGGSGPALPAGESRASLPPDDFVGYFRRMDPRQKGFIYQQVKAEMQAEEEAAASPPAPAPALSAWEQAGLNAAQPPPVLRQQGILQVHQSYLITQDEQGLLIVDQHALHERVMFEDLRRRILERPLESQRLLMPTVLPADAQRQARLEELAPLLAQIGIEAEPMGPTSVGIHAFPSLLFERKVDPAGFLEELLDRAEEEGFEVNQPQAREAALHEVLDMMACKAAVKAGEALTAEELAALLARREEIERASNCPHGRPTTIRLTLRDLEKHFHRA